MDKEGGKLWQPAKTQVVPGSQKEGRLEEKPKGVAFTHGSMAMGAWQWEQRVELEELEEDEEISQADWMM